VDLCEEAVEKLGKVVIWPFWTELWLCDEDDARAFPLTGTMLPLAGVAWIKG